MAFPVSLLGLRGQGNSWYYFWFGSYGSFFEGLPLVLKRKIVEYSAMQSLNHWTSNFNFQRMNTEEFIDFKIHCYLSAYLSLLL